MKTKVYCIPCLGVMYTIKKTFRRIEYRTKALEGLPTSDFRLLNFLLPSQRTDFSLLTSNFRLVTAI